MEKDIEILTAALELAVELMDTPERHQDEEWSLQREQILEVLKDYEKSKEPSSLPELSVKNCFALFLADYKASNAR